MELRLQLSILRKDSVVRVEGDTADGGVQGSGFVYDFAGRMVVLTNYHVVQDTTDLSVTFANGNGYSATVLGDDAYSDFAVLSVDAPAFEFKPVTIVSSASLRVGEPVIAIGNPYGLGRLLNYRSCQCYWKNHK